MTWAEKWRKGKSCTFQPAFRKSNMLKHRLSILLPERLKILMEMGLGDEIVE